MLGIFFFLAMVGAIIGLVTIGSSHSAARQAKLVAAALEYRNVAEAWIARLDAGTVSPIRPDGIVPIHGEQFFYGESAQLGAYIKGHRYSSSSPALYVPLGHGLRARVGGSRGRTAPDQQFVWGPHGTVYLSTLRVVFKAATSADAMSAPYPEIQSFESYDAGLEINVKHIGLQQLRTGNAVLGQVFRHVVEHVIPTVEAPALA